jgi:hypothetical protein
MHYSKFRVNVIKKQDTSNQSIIVPIIRKTKREILNDWLNEYAPARYESIGRERRLMYDFFNHDFTVPTKENNYIEPYTQGDIDITDNSTEKQSDEYTSALSDFYEDKEVSFIHGTNRCSANMFYKNMLLAVQDYDTTIPMMESSPEGIEYFNGESPIILEKEEVYKMLMKMSYT